MHPNIYEQNKILEINEANFRVKKKCNNSTDSIKHSSINGSNMARRSASICKICKYRFLDFKLNILCVFIY